MIFPYSCNLNISKLHTPISPFVVYFPVWNRALMHSNESAARVVLISSVRVHFECPHDDELAHFEIVG